MKISKGLLICAHKEYAEIIFLSFPERMQIEHGFHSLGIDKMINTAIGIAGNVRNYALS